MYMYLKENYLFGSRQNFFIFNFGIRLVFPEEGTRVDGGGEEETVDSGDEEDSPDLSIQGGSDHGCEGTSGPDY